MLAALAASTKACELGVGLAVHAAAAHGRELRGVPHHARAAEHGGDIGGAGDGRVLAEDRRDALVAVDAVLQGDDAGVRADQRLRQLGGGLGVPQLDREQHDVDRADLLRIVGGVDLRQMQVAVHALDLQAVLAQRVEMGAARDEGDVVARRRHAVRRNRRRPRPPPSPQSACASLLRPSDRSCYHLAPNSSSF